MECKEVWSSGGTFATVRNIIKIYTNFGNYELQVVSLAQFLSRYFINRMDWRWLLVVKT